MPRQIRVEGDVAFIPLTQGKEAVIDTADVHLVEGVNWYAAKNGHTYYVARNVRTPGVRRQRHLFLHRLIFGASEGVTVDHRDGDGLNCRRANLRQATAAENAMNRKRAVCNTSGVKGVTFHAKMRRWQAQIGVNGKVIYLGLFDDLEAATEAYATASCMYHGDFGRVA